MNKKVHSACQRSPRRSPRSPRKSPRKTTPRKDMDGKQLPPWQQHKKKIGPAKDGGGPNLPAWQRRGLSKRNMKGNPLWDDKFKNMYSNSRAEADLARSDTAWYNNGGKGGR